MQLAVNTAPLSWQRAAQLLSRYSIGSTSLYRRVEEGLLPPPVRIGPNTSAWPQHELDVIDRARLAGADDAKIRGLVQQLVIARKEAA